MKHTEVYKDYNRFKSQAKKLKTWILKEFEQQKQFDLFNSIVFPWMAMDHELPVVEFG